jgi:2-oxoglutarate ferredoxin oxidoreductase subunit beta
MNTYGFHTIHGRATAVASGAKLSNPNLSVWIITGDGDAMSIGGNHLVHILRRNIDLNILMFNNRIYGLTKGQYSPTSELGKKTKSTPMGSLDHPFNPLSLALGAGATFVARSLDRESKHLGELVKKCNEHRGTSFVDIYQNCNIFNDGAFSDMSDKETKLDSRIILENGEPMLFGLNKSKGLRMDGSKIVAVDIGDDFSIDDILVHDEGNKSLAFYLSEITLDPYLPTPIGVLYKEDKPTYNDMMIAQIDEAIKTKGKGDLKSLLYSGHTWEVS